MGFIERVSFFMAVSKDVVGRWRCLPFWWGEALVGRVVWFIG